MSRIKLLLDVADDIESLAASLKSLAEELKDKEILEEDQSAVFGLPEEEEPVTSGFEEIKCAPSSDEPAPNPAKDDPKPEITKSEVRILLQTVPPEIAHRFLEECGEQRLTNVDPKYFPILAEKVRCFNAAQKTRDSVGVVSSQMA